jgi:hypothetical protein
MKSVISSLILLSATLLWQPENPEQVKALVGDFRENIKCLNEVQTLDSDELLEVLIEVASIEVALNKESVSLSDLGASLETSLVQNLERLAFLKHAEHLRARITDCLEKGEPCEDLQVELSDTLRKVGSLKTIPVTLKRVPGYDYETEVKAHSAFFGG